MNLLEHAASICLYAIVLLRLAYQTLLQPDTSPTTALPYCTSQSARNSG